MIEKKKLQGYKGKKTQLPLGRSWSTPRDRSCSPGLFCSPALRIGFNHPPLPSSASSTGCWGLRGLLEMGIE